MDTKTSLEVMDNGSRSGHKGFSEYQYKPLGETKQEIRLLWVLPFDAQDPHLGVNCGIIPAFLGDRPQFEALSYVWGTDAKDCHIWVGFEKIPVTANLLKALQHYHAKINSPSFLWVDAICINQNSVTERNQQVGFMRDIFAQALRTIVWLGGFDFLPTNKSSNFLDYVHNKIVAKTESSSRTSSEELILQDLNTRRILCRP